MSGRTASTGIIPGRYAICVGHAQMPSPQGWKWILLSNLARLETGHTPSRNHPEYWNDGCICWIGIKDARLHHGRRINDTLQKVTQLGIDNSAARLLPVGTVCLSRTASVGYVFVLGRDMATSQDFVNWVCSEALVSEFLMYALMAEGEDIRRFGKGTTHTTIYFPEVKAFHICVPPLNEQRRIVAKIEELFSDLDAGVAALKRAKANLKRYRASVLKAAVEGKLTEQWRAKHPAKEPASALLARILLERRQKWEADQLAKFAAAKKEPPKNWRDKYVEPTPPDTTGLPELPEGWCWASVEQLGDVQLGRQRSPKNRSNEFPTKYIRAANLTENGLDLSDVMDMEFQPHELETYRLHPGDVLLSEASGSPDQVGKPVVWNGEIEDCCFQNTVIRLRPVGMPSDYALTVFRHYYRSKLFAKVSAGVGINHLSAGKFSALPFPLSPLIEQTQIVIEVDEHLSQIDAAEVQIEHGLLRAARLRQSILKRAFEGKLVPQDPKDEPASALLERLRASRTIHEGSGNRPTSSIPHRSKSRGKKS
jgi:type I restriction enzyme S subunit